MRPFYLTLVFLRLSLFFLFWYFSVCLNAKHVQKKAAKRANHRRPRKSRLSDINRKPTNYPSFEKPSEYTISDAPATPVTKPSEE